MKVPTGGPRRSPIGEPESSPRLGRGGTLPALLHIGRDSVLDNAKAREKAMVYTVAIILLILWLLGLVSGYTIGAFIHVLLVIALVLVLLQLLSGRRLA